MVAADAVASNRSDEGPLAVRADRLFDGVDATLVQHAVVLIEFGRVVAVLSGTDPPPAVRVVDLGAVTLLPGLIDSHVHTVFDASQDPVGHIDAADDDQVLATIRANARLALSAGVTTVRDLGDRGYLSLKIRDEFAADPTAGPQILAAGPPGRRSRRAADIAGSSAAKPPVESTRSAPRSVSTPNAAWT